MPRPNNGGRVRTLAGNVQILGLEPRLLLPFVNPVWAQYASHKIGRLVVPYALLTLFTASIALAGQRPIYTVALVAQTALYLLGGYGAWLDFQTSRVTRLAASSPGRRFRTARQCLTPECHASPSIGSPGSRSPFSS